MSTQFFTGIVKGKNFTIFANAQNIKSNQKEVCNISVGLLSSYTTGPFKFKKKVLTETRNVDQWKRIEGPGKYLYKYN